MEIAVNSMEAIVLAGGLGTRLRSVVSDVPKCMAPVAGHPFLYYILQYLQKNKVTHVVLALGYKHEIVTDWLKKQDFGMDYSFSIEELPLGTGGAIRQALACIKEQTALVLNGDTFFGVNLQDFRACHLQSHKPVSLALKPMEDFDRYGNVEVTTGGLITAFHEKGHCDKGYINGGIYCMEKDTDLFLGCPGKSSFETDILQQKVRQGVLNGYISDGYFIDIGIPEDFEKANQHFLHHPEVM